jgi:hypothetical protein
VNEAPRTWGDGAGEVRRAREAPAPARRTPPFSPFCLRCGARFPTAVRGEWLETGSACVECGIALRSASPLLPITGEDIAYHLGRLTVAERAAVTADLIELRIPYRWEDALMLVVAPAHEAHVDELLDEILS